MSGLPIPGNFLPNDGRTTGEIVVRAPWFTKGYYKDAEKTEELWHGGWLHTGDVGYMDQDGYIQITDRLKDVIKTGGEWVSSLDLENAISLQSAVAGGGGYQRSRSQVGRTTHAACRAEIPVP